MLSLGIVVAIAYFSACVLLFFLQPRLIYHPTPIVKNTPKSCQISYQDVWLPVKNNAGKIERIHGWWISVSAERQSLGTLLYLHGAGLNIGSNVNQACNFQKLGFSVLLIDYRGYGRSQGSFPSESQIYQDAEVAWDYLIKNRRIPTKKIFLYGHSLGGAVAIELALKHPEAAGLIVHNSFISMEKMVERHRQFRLFPVKLLLTQRFNSIAKVKLLRLPVLFIHGADDTYIPATMSQKLYKNAPQPKRFLLVPKARHNNGDLFWNNPQYRQTIIDFAKPDINQRELEGVQLPH